MNASIRPSGGAVTQFPMMPEKITLGADAKFMTYSIISLGDVKIPRGQGIKEISWSGIFPGKARKNYPFVSSWVDPNTLIKRMEQYRDNGTICKLLVTGTCINYSVYISSFKGKYSGGLGDFYYDIKFIIAREIKIYTTKELKIGTSSKTQRPASKKSNKKSTTGSKTTTYTIKSGDTLSNGNGKNTEEVLLMKITHLPEDGKNFIPYEVSGKTIDFDDGELMFNVSKKERDYEVVIDICEDYTGGLVMGADAGDKYVAQIIIPAREYTEVEKENPNYDPENEEGTEQPTIKELKPVPFSMDRCELRLWEREV